MVKTSRVPDSWRTGETQSRLLDSAETLFMEHGYEATRLRQITSAANVNLAAVNYHFGGKEGLFQSVLMRRLDPLNQERLKLLDELEDGAHGTPLTAEKI
jgi:AcrR family transcriptional regulator